MLARLFTQPANMMILDEPTNDLDVDTLELLEDLLVAYDGTLLLVSHDRTFLDNVVSSILVFEEQGQVREYIGGYEDWLKQSGQLHSMENKGRPSTPEKSDNKPGKDKRKLSYKESCELQELPQKIEMLESEQAEIEGRVCDSEFYQLDEAVISKTLARLTTLQAELSLAYERWEYLEEQW